MADITLSIGGHHYAVSCADGEEAELLRLAAIVDREAAAARASIGGLTEVRQLLFASLFLADKLNSSAPSDPDDQLLARRIDAAAARIERLVAKLSPGLE